MFRMVSAVIALCLLASPRLVAQQPEVIYLYLDVKDSSIHDTVFPLLDSPDDLAAGYPEEIDQLMQIFHRQFPAWEFKPWTSATPYPKLTVTLKHVGGDPLERAQLDAKLVLERDDSDQRRPICDLTLYKPVELEADLRKGDGRLLFKEMFLNRFKTRLEDATENSLKFFKDQVPVGRQFLAFVSPKTAVLPWPWERFGYWSQSKFETRCPLDDGGEVILYSEARGSYFQSTNPTGQFVKIEHLELKLPGKADREKADAYLSNLPKYIRGAIYLTELRRYEGFKRTNSNVAIASH